VTPAATLAFLGAALVEVLIDQGWIAEMSRPTTHSIPLRRHCLTWVKRRGRVGSSLD